MKQWKQSLGPVSLAPPVAEVLSGEDSKWAEPPMPRDYHMLQPWTQQLLRAARSGKVGAKRKTEDAADEDFKPEDEDIKDDRGTEERGFVAKKWKPVPEHSLVPEHMHWEYLAKRRKGLPNTYGAGFLAAGAAVPMRKTKVQKPDASTGTVAVYEVLVPEGQTVEGEVTETAELAEVQPVAPAPGTVIEGVGRANEEGVVVAESLLQQALVPRRNRPPPRKKGGPGRGKKRVTFTNADGSTYTTVVPNATKIVPAPGQTVKHVAKGEEAGADLPADAAPADGDVDGTRAAVGEEEGSGSDEGDEGDEGDEDDDREEGELSEADEGPASTVTNTTPALPQEPGVAPPTDAAKDIVPAAEAQQTYVPTTSVQADRSSSPEEALSKTIHSRQGSLTAQPTLTLTEAVAVETAASQPEADEELQGESERFSDGDDDLLGSLERHLDGEGKQA